MVPANEPWLPSFPSSSPRFCNPIHRRIFTSDVGGSGGDITLTVHVEGHCFVLHKYPLVSCCGRIQKLIASSNDPNLSNLHLRDVPGGPAAFDLAIKFCYGLAVDITPANVVQLRCMADYLEMADPHNGSSSLLTQTEAYLSCTMFTSLKLSLQVLATCTRDLSPAAEAAGIVDRCADSIAMNISRDQLASELERLHRSSNRLSDQDFKRSPDWWVEDLTVLNIDHYSRVIAAMRRAGVRSECIVASIMHYARASLRGIDRSGPVCDQQHVRPLVEAIVGLMAAEKVASIMPLPFLFGILRVAVEVNTGMDCRIEIEKHIALQLERASLDDLLIPAAPASNSPFDVDTVHRILINFLQRINEEEDDDEEESSGAAGSSSELDDGRTPGHLSAALEVGQLMDGYLAEIATDPYLELQKFMAIIELLPDYARIVDDGLYRAIDIYLKAHPSLTDAECRKLCKLIDCEKLSPDAATHAAQNERLPVQMTIRLLYFEQLRLKSALSGDAAAALSQRLVSGSGVASAAASPRDGYASLRRENRELRMEIARMRARVSELEREQRRMMKQGGMKEGKAGENGRAFLASLSRGFGRIAKLAPATAAAAAERKKTTTTKARSGRSQ